MLLKPEEALKKYSWELLEDLFSPKTIAHRMLRYDVEKYNVLFRNDLIAGRVPGHMILHYQRVLRFDVPAERYYRLLRDTRNDPLIQHTRVGPQAKKGSPTIKSK